MKPWILGITALLSITSVQGNDMQLHIPGEVSGGLAITTDYRFRGISQTSDNPAVQGSLDYQLPLNNYTDLYLGVWGSNVDFAGSLEFDYMGGLRMNLSPFAVDFGATYYSYPGAPDSEKLDFWEFSAKGAYTFGSTEAVMTYGLHYSPNYFSQAKDAWYNRFGASIPLAYGLFIDGHVGHQAVERAKDYYEWGVGIAAQVKTIDLHLGYVNTSLNKRQCSQSPLAGARNICDGKFIFTVARAF